MTKLLGEARVLEPLFRVAVWIGGGKVDGGANEAGDVGNRLLEVVVVVSVAVRPLANLTNGVGVVGTSIKVAILVWRIGADGRRHL